MAHIKDCVHYGTVRGIGPMCHAHDAVVFDCRRCKDYRVLQRERVKTQQMRLGAIDAGEVVKLEMLIKSKRRYNLVRALYEANGWVSNNYLSTESVAGRDGRKRCSELRKQMGDSFIESRPDPNPAVNSWQYKLSNQAREIVRLALEGKVA